MVAFVASTEGVLPTRQAVMQKKAIAKYIHRLALARVAPAALQQLFIRLPALAAPYMARQGFATRYSFRLR